ncbi:2-oxoglutarate dehydrogenase, E2 component, dihydrolipoamide succinyltransferase [Nigerium massiliense]|uniref:2-oxoglutarate dehydrogenase, E2 component, dihydrolipoamide succinyltransferase n=1 Tax=Nigerium massiliense TaxID=1522317 RepID=UPI001F301380|nr:2-oxoglutarate dehydrogenase, E2 component, dihydrolipoamide succinyltransferase [Nigerium massiliense]
MPRRPTAASPATPRPKSRPPPLRRPASPRPSRPTRRRTPPRRPSRPRRRRHPRSRSPRKNRSPSPSPRRRPPSPPRRGLPSPPPRPRSRPPRGPPRAAGFGASGAGLGPRAAEGGDATYVTPLVRKLAADNGVDLATVQGSGVGGRIRKQDVLDAAEAAKKPQAPAAAQSAPSAPAPQSAKAGTTEKVTRLRATIARRMKESLEVSAQLTATVEVDLTAISRIRAQVKDDFKAREGVSLSYLPFISKAAVEGLRQFPKLNATIDTEAGQITYAASEDLGIAVDTEKGLLVPVIKDAGDLTVAGLAKRIGDLGARTRANKVGPDELTGGTFTITNYGSAGTLMDTPIINQPQVAILGTGAMVKRPVVISDPELGDIIAVRDMMYLSLTYDHRLVDGADAARYLSFVKARLEEGEFGAEFGL